MPIYAYRCTECTHRDEVIRPTHQMDEGLECSACGGPMERIPFPGGSFRMNTPDAVLGG
jgi:putative FmdB family regulatory protein